MKNKYDVVVVGAGTADINKRDFRKTIKGFWGNSGIARIAYDYS